MANSGQQQRLSTQEGNEEGEDLATPLPPYWDVETLRGMKLVLYGQKLSPPCCKLRFLFGYYKVPFEDFTGRRPDSEYKKVPALDIGDRQINDSFIIVKNLAPALQGRPLTDDELELERQVTYGLMIAMEKDVAGSMQDLCACAGFVGGCIGCFVRCTSCFICCLVPRKIGAGKELRTVEAYGDILRDHLGAGQFLGGGNAPSVIDCSVFGVIEPFFRAECSCVDRLLGAPGNALRSWHDRMLDATRHVDIFA